MVLAALCKRWGKQSSVPIYKLPVSCNNPELVRQFSQASSTPPPAWEEVGGGKRPEKDSSSVVVPKEQRTRSYVARWLFNVEQ
jgi:hypothetical protein